MRPPPSAEKMFTFDKLNFEKLGYAPPLAGHAPLSDFLDMPLVCNHRLQTVFSMTHAFFSLCKIR